MTRAARHRRLWERIPIVRPIWLTLWYGWPLWVFGRLLWRGGKPPLHWIPGHYGGHLNDD